MSFSALLPNIAIQTEAASKVRRTYYRPTDYCFLIVISKLFEIVKTLVKENNQKNKQRHKFKVHYDEVYKVYNFIWLENNEDLMLLIWTDSTAHNRDKIY